MKVGKLLTVLVWSFTLSEKLSQATKKANHTYIHLALSIPLTKRNMTPWEICKIPARRSGVRGDAREIQKQREKEEGGIRSEHSFISVTAKRATRKFLSLYNSLAC